MTSHKKLFLSAVSSEFESYRRLLAGDLKRPTLDVHVQEDFGVSGGLTLQKLDDYIKACDGVVHLIGKATGAMPEAVAVRVLLTQYPDFVEKLTLLDDAWNDSHKYVVVVRGKGGEGKTSLVATWMAELATKDWRD